MELGWLIKLKTKMVCVGHVTVCRGLAWLDSAGRGISHFPSVEPWQYHSLACNTRILHIRSDSFLDDAVTFII